MLHSNFLSIQKLLDFLAIPEEKRALVCQNPRFALNVPLRIAEKMEKGNLEDPLFLQFVPLQSEQLASPSFCKDPVLDKQFCKSSKMIQKYAKRVLLVTTGACAMNCRYCFRQNFPYEKKHGFETELASIAQDDSLIEVILSGGDPLSLPHATLERLLFSLDSIAHLKIIRFHTRFPIGIPERINQELLSVFARIKKQIVFVLHTNHPKELDALIFERLKEIQKLGIPVLTQTVLLKGVNDNTCTLEELFSLITSHGILPYQLHALDKVEGSSHFEVPIEKGKLIMQELIDRLPGYAIPQFVADIPGKKAKTRLMHV